jgi:glycosyltransferase involved in cell wall biosynthesis
MSGVQRVLQHLAREWSRDAIEAQFGFIRQDRYVTGPICELGAVISSSFQAVSGTMTVSSVTVQRALENVSSKSTVSIREIYAAFDAYLLPEPTFRRDSLEVAEGLREHHGATSFFIYYDALPLTHPQFFPKSADRNGAISRYHEVVAASENVAFISQMTRRIFETRVARREVANAVVAKPGADGLVNETGVRSRLEPPTFTVLGTVEPRKGHRFVLDAFERLWTAGRDYRLIFIGAPYPEQPEFLARVRRHAATARLEWIEEAGDDVVAKALAGSSALVFVPQVEGYGLPPLEALASGCPVVVPADLPALADLSDGGQIRLSSVTAEGVASAVDILADPRANASYRGAIADLKLPTWKQFAGEVEGWITAALDRAAT